MTTAEPRMYAPGTGAERGPSPESIVLQSRLFDGLPKADRQAILAAGSQRNFVSDCVVTQQEDPAHHLFMLTRGGARHFFITPEGRKILLLWLKPGEIFGGVALLPAPSSYLAGTEVEKGSCVCVWRRDKIREFAKRYPVLLENALSIASEYFVWFIAAHVALVCDNAQERLAGVLVSLAGGIGRQVRDGISLDITNEQLANVANVSPFTASRLLAGWQRSGLLRKGRGRILLRSPERLRFCGYSSTVAFTSREKPVVEDV